MLNFDFLQWGTYRNNVIGTAHLYSDRTYNQDCLDWIRKNKIHINCGITYNTYNVIRKQLLKEDFFINKIRYSDLLRINKKESFKTVKEILQKKTIDELIDNLIKTRYCKKGDNSPVDLMLLHSPVGKPHETYPEINLKCWKILIRLQELGYVKQIGVSNFSIKDLKNLVENSNKKPILNEIELSPLISRESLVEYCKKERIKVSAYWLLRGGDSNLINNRILKEIAINHNASVPLVIYQWCIQRGIIPIVGTFDIKKLENLKKIIEGKLILTLEEMKKIDDLNIDLSYSQRNKSSEYHWGWFKRDFN